MTFETMTSEFPHAAHNCVPSFDQAILNSDPVFGFSRECDHWKSKPKKKQIIVESESM